MSTSKHTPGPWTIKPYKSWDKRILLPEPSIYVDNDDVDQDEASANARLIAAAPDLLAALEDAFVFIGTSPHDPALLLRTRAAIAKAKGEIKE